MWNDYQNVPDAWIATANAQFEGAPNRLNDWLFWSVPFKQEARIKMLVRAFTKGE